MNFKSKCLNIIKFTNKVIKKLNIKTSGGDTIKQKSIYISLLALCMVIGGLFLAPNLNQDLSKDSRTNLVQSSSATSTSELPSEQKVNAKSKVKKSGIISARGECSCSLFTSLSTISKSWVNYCPKCHKYGKLSFTRGGGCPEGMLYCNMAKGGCDADYCAVHGKEHINKGADHLIPA